MIITELISLEICVSVKRDFGEITIAAATINELIDFLKSNPDAFNLITSLIKVTPSPPPSAVAKPEKIFTGCAEKLSIILNEGFFDFPKKFGEITQELNRRTWFYDKRRIDDGLKILIRAGKLNRLGERGEYQYVKVP